MKIIRSIVSVIVGYLLFAVPSYAFFVLSGQPPHQEAPIGIMASSIVVGMLAAFTGGYVAALLAGRQPFGHGVAVAVVLALGAAVSLSKTIGHGAIWSQVAALVLMAPSAILGGRTRARQPR